MNKWIRLALIIFFSAVLIFSCFMLIRYAFNSRKQASTFDQLAEMVANATVPATRPPVTTDPVTGETMPPEPTEPQPIPEYIEVSKLNPHMVGWIQIPDTKINYPVMHAPEERDHYLHRDFYGDYSYHGCLYIQEQCDVTLPTDNITIYGHNMNDGSMFADLNKYADKSFWESHRYITFNTLMEYHTYEVFAVFITTASKGEGFTYHQFINAKDAQEFDQYIADCKAWDLYDTGITPVYGEKLITLSTCDYNIKNGRFVVVARRVS